MSERGWRGRPLLVVDLGTVYQAWTGSHRIAAACEAGLSEVPCYVVSGKDMASMENPIFDHERLKILRELGDADAVRLMWLEGRE
jgi:hypothetical protein